MKIRVGLLILSLSLSSLPLIWVNRNGKAVTPQIEEPSAAPEAAPAKARHTAPKPRGDLGRVPSMGDWIKQLDDQDQWVRIQAAQALGTMGPRAKPAIPALIRTLTSRLPLTQPYIGGICTDWDNAPGKAREALVRIGPAAIPALREALRHEDRLVRVNAAWALWELDKRADVVVPVLKEAFYDKHLYIIDECIRADAAVALGNIGTELPEQILPILLKAIEDEDIVLGAMKSLRVMGPEVKEAVAKLIAALIDKRKGIGNSARLQLGELGSAAVPQLLIALTDKNPSMRARAAWTFSGMEPEVGKDAIAALKKAAADPDEEVRKDANFALKQLTK
jgi:HEAT repeat protein